MPLRDPRTWSQTHLHSRNPDPSGSRSWGDVTDILGDIPHQVGKEMLGPAIANRTRNAINVDRREVFLYQKLREGRRCSCWSSIEATPTSSCPVCFQTGWAGGFWKWGTHLYLFDPSRQWVGVNTKLDSSKGLPLWFSLEEGKTYGYIEWDEGFTAGTYYGVDSWVFDYRKGRGNISMVFKLDGVDPSFIPFTDQAFKQRVLAATGGRMVFRVIMERPVSTDESPCFQQFWFRLLTNSAEPPVIMVDIPRRAQSNALADFGSQEVFNQVQFAFPDTIQRINLEDLIIRLHDMTRWSVVESSPNDPLNLLTSHDVQARKVFDYDSKFKVPL